MTIQKVNGHNPVETREIYCCNVCLSTNALLSKRFAIHKPRQGVSPAQRTKILKLAGIMSVELMEKAFRAKVMASNQFESDRLLFEVSLTVPVVK